MFVCMETSMEIILKNYNSNQPKINASVSFLLWSHQEVHQLLRCGGTADAAVRDEHGFGWECRE